MARTNYHFDDQYDGLWLAVDRDSDMIVRRGSTPEEALAQAKPNGFARGAELTFVTQETIGSLGLNDPDLARLRRSTRRQERKR